MNILISVLRTGAQALVGSLVAYLAARGLDVPVDVQHWLVDGLLVTGGVAAYTAVVRWLETRDSTLARIVARILMLGQQPPTYGAQQSRPAAKYMAP